MGGALAPLPGRCRWRRLPDGRRGRCHRLGRRQRSDGVSELGAVVEDARLWRRIRGAFWLMADMVIAVVSMKRWMDGLSLVSVESVVVTKECGVGSSRDAVDAEAGGWWRCVVSVGCGGGCSRACRERRRKCGIVWGGMVGVANVRMEVRRQGKEGGSLALA